MKNQSIMHFEGKNQTTKTHPNFRPGDTIKVHYKIEEASKSGSSEKKFRIQAFEGVCIRFKKGGVSSSFTVRKIAANSVGVERVFAYHSKLIDKIEILAGGMVRQARLYYLRDLSGKAARIKSRRLKAGELMATATEGEEAKPKKKKDKKKKK